MTRRLSIFEPLSDPLSLMRAFETHWNHELPIASHRDAFSPSVTTREGDYAYHIDVDLPGVRREDIHVELRDHALTISGERRMRNETDEDGVYRCESQYGRFSRSFTLPENIDEEHISASTTDGVLEVVIPRLTQTEHADDARRIEVA